MPNSYYALVSTQGTITESATGMLFQVAGGLLIHDYWTPGQETNGSENVFAKVGLGQPVLPAQYPQAAIINNELCGAKWGAKELS